MKAKPELVVASAWKPSASSIRAEPASHGFGITNGSPSCSARNASRLPLLPVGHLAREPVVAGASRRPLRDLRVGLWRARSCPRRRSRRASRPSRRPCSRPSSRRPTCRARRRRPAGSASRPRRRSRASSSGGQWTKSHARSGRSSPSTISSASPASTRKSSWSSSQWYIAIASPGASVTRLIRAARTPARPRGARTRRALGRPPARVARVEHVPARPFRDEPVLGLLQLRLGHHRSRAYRGFSQTETCLRLSLVKGSRFQSAQRSRRRMPASSAIRSSSAGHT